MLIDVRMLRDGQPVAILGLGHTVLPEDCRYDNDRFVLKVLSAAGQLGLSRDVELSDRPTLEEFLSVADQKFVAVTGIRTRYIFPGTTAELGAAAAVACLADAGCSAAEVDAIIVGTNTGTGYPSTADLIKGLIDAPSDAFCCDVQEACSVGVVAVQLGWEKVRSRNFRRVLVVGAEKASTLASPDDYKGANLFGDAAFSMLLGPAERDQFVFFASGSDPHHGQAEYIRRTPRGFVQDGPAVHAYVGLVVPEVLAETFERLRLDPALVDHLFPHQPSAKTIDFFLKRLRKRWAAFRATVHRNVEEMGNTSGACTGWMMSRAKQAGSLKSDQLGLVASFGAGMSWGFYGFTVP